MIITAVTLVGTATAQTGTPPARRGNGLADKQPDLTAGLFTAGSTVARTKMRHVVLAFVMFQEIAANTPAVTDSWPRAIAFMNQYSR